jgi:hypothetical protein
MIRKSSNAKVWRSERDQKQRYLDPKGIKRKGLVIRKRSKAKYDDQKWIKDKGMIIRTRSNEKV